jgi:hypothetical protein
MEIENTIKCCCCDKIYDTRHPNDFKEKRNGKYKDFYHITEATIGDYKELHEKLTNKLHIGDIPCRGCAYKVKDYMKSKTKKREFKFLDEEHSSNKIRKETIEIDDVKEQKEGTLSLITLEIKRNEEEVSFRFEAIMEKLGINKMKELLDNIDPSGVVSRIIFLNYLRTLKGTQV